jgi:hypothetical protein
MRFEMLNKFWNVRLRNGYAYANLRIDLSNDIRSALSFSGGVLRGRRRFSSMKSIPANSKERQAFFSNRTPTRNIQQKDEIGFVLPKCRS